MQYRLGKTAARPDAVKFKLADYINRAVLPVPPKDHSDTRIL